LIITEIAVLITGFACIIGEIIARRTSCACGCRCACAALKWTWKAGAVYSIHGCGEAG